jgi:nucleotide-binding universal stress UspA family protein
MSTPDESAVVASVGARRSGHGPTVFVPLDGSQSATRALPVARALAQLEGGSLHIVHATEHARPAREVIGRLGTSPEALFGTVLDEVQGPAAEAIVRLAAQTREARIVMCVRGKAAAPGQEISPSTLQVLSEADCPVLVVRAERGPAPWTLRRLLLPHDGSPLTATAFGPALRLAGLASATLFVLHVATLTGVQAPGAMPVPCYVDQPQHEWPEWSREFLERIEAFWELPADLRPRLFVSRGEPGEEILRFAAGRQIDLIGLAWHGSLARERAATLKEVILAAPCPVLFQRVDEAGFWSRYYPVPLSGPANLMS